MSRKLTTEQFIERAIKKHGNRYDYSKVEYISTKTKVTIICKDHGELYQIPNSHFKGHGCPKCANINTSNRVLSNTYDFINKAIKIHGDKYDYSRVEYVTAKTKVTIICKDHGEFLQHPNGHLNARGCTQCGVIGSTKLKSSTTNRFINKAIEIHGNKYDYSKVEYINSKTNVIIICKEHGLSLQMPNSHFKGHGCPKCANNSHVGKYKQTTRELWGNKDGYFYNVELKHKDSNETFNKVGITINPDSRFEHYSPYEVVDIIELTEMKLGNAFDKEQEFIKTMNKYTPLEKFGGYTECYRI